jgi:ribosomal protein S2
LGTRFNRIIFDVDWTFVYLKRALLFVSRLVVDRRAVILFACGVSNFYYKSLNRYAICCSQPYYGSVYVGGSLSNFFNVKRRVTSLKYLRFLPSVILVFNPKECKGLIVEAIKLNIPVVSVFSADMNLSLITYPVPCNFSRTSLSFVANLFSRSIVAARLSESKFLFPVDSYVFRSLYSYEAKKLNLKRLYLRNLKLSKRVKKKKICRSGGQIFFSSSLWKGRRFLAQKRRKKKVVFRRFSRSRRRF